MTCDPTTLQTIGDYAQLGVALVALAALVFAARSSAASRRSAAVAERTLAAQTRPLLTDVERQFYTDGLEHELLLPGGEARKTPMHGEIMAHEDEGWISLPIVNAGRGEAYIETVALDIAGVGGMTELGSAAQRRHVQPGAEVRLDLAPGRVSLAWPAFKEAIDDGAGIIVRVGYLSIATDRVYDSFFELRRRGGGPWRVADSWVVEDT